MAGAAVRSGGTERTFTANFTWYMFFSCLVAASGGAVSFSTPPLPITPFVVLRIWAHRLRLS